MDIEVEECCAIMAKVRYLRGMGDDLKIEFQKWEGTGNTFAIVNGFKYAGSLDLTTLEDKVVAEICLKQNCDGLICLVESSIAEADLKCDYRNSDGTRSFCGNGTRASFEYAHREGLIGDNAVFEACDGLHKVRRNDEYDVPSVEFRPVVAPKSLSSGDFFLDTGSPHHIHLVKDFDELSQLEIDTFGRKIRYSDDYSSIGGVNVSALCTVSEGLALRTYERGVEAETKACGTGAVAASIVDYSIHGGKPKRTIHMSGGKLFVEFKEDGEGGYENVWLSGAARELYRGITRLLPIFLLWFCMPLEVHANWYDSLSGETKVSILTSSPGEDAYSIFGHTAVRIYDPAEVPVVDWVFNYGTFSFSEDFYYNFMIGRLDYHLSAVPFYQFQRQNIDQERGVKEQILNLTPAQIRQVAEYLSWNLQEENVVYRYEFFRDNCSTRIITLFQESLGASFETHCKKSGKTFRDGLQPYIAGSPWTAFGMDFILGPKSDKIMPPCGDAFIPDELSKALSSMTVDGVGLLKDNHENFVVFDDGAWLPDSALDVPAVLMVFITSLMIIVTFRNREKCGFASKLRGVVALVSSLLGILLLLMWSFTDHTDTWANINLLWTLAALVYFIPIQSGFKRQAGKIAALICISYLILSVFEFQLSTLALRCAAVSVFLTVIPFRKDLNLVRDE